MNNLNSILIEGNLVKDALLEIKGGGSHICTFTVAANRFYRNSEGMQKEVSFFDVEAWAKLAESCHTHGFKGKGVRVVGRLKQSRWKTADGQSRSRIYIVAEHVEFRPSLTKQDEISEGMDEDAL